jgi:hypothetical protein
MVPSDEPVPTPSVSEFTDTEPPQPINPPEPLPALEPIGDEGKPADPWHDKFDDLVAFHKRFGHCYVPHPWPEQPGLGIWVQTQRQERQAGTISAEHIARLDEIHFFWTGGWEVLGEDWRQKQKEVMGRFYRDPEIPPEHYRIYRKPVVPFDEEDFESC